MKRSILIVIYILVTIFCAALILFGLWQRYLTQFPLSSPCSAEEIAIEVANLHNGDYKVQNEEETQWTIDYVNSNLGTDYYATGIDIWEVYNPDTLATYVIVIDFAGHEKEYDEFMQTIVPKLDSISYNYSVDKNSLKFYGAPFDNYFFQRDMIYVNTGVNMACAEKPWNIN